MCLFYTVYITNLVCHTNIELKSNIFVNALWKNTNHYVLIHNPPPPPNQTKQTNTEAECHLSELIER